MEQEFVKWMDWYGKSYGEFEIHKGDFLDAEFSNIINSATSVPYRVTCVGWVGVGTKHIGGEDKAITLTLRRCFFPPPP